MIVRSIVFWKSVICVRLVRILCIIILAEIGIKYRANYKERPIYLNENLYKGTYKRDAEGDYKSTEEEKSKE